MIYDDACIRCDSPEILPQQHSPELVTYKCRECGYVWSSDDDTVPS